jgi:serine/threonine protein phosphatase PrpC
VLTADAVTLCWLGDSRAYWLGTGAGADAQLLTKDDSLAEEMVTAGLLAEADALDSPQAHVVTRWVGADLRTVTPHVARFEPPGHGVVLVCSDGLWNYEPAAEKLARLALPTALTDPLGAAASLIRFALDAGGGDNVTVVLALFPPLPPVPAVSQANPDQPAEPAPPGQSAEPDPAAMLGDSVTTDQISPASRGEPGEPAPPAATGPA